MNVYRSHRPAVDIPDVPVHRSVLRHARALADRPAVVEAATGRTLGFGELASSADRLAGGLVARGFGRGSVLAIVSANRLEYAVVFHAVSKAGGTLTTLNPGYRASEMAAQLADAGAGIVIADAQAMPEVSVAVAGTGTELVGLDETGPRNWRTLWGEPLVTEPDIVPGRDVAVLPYSSGTTGLPKGVMLTHRNLVANIEQFGAVTAFDVARERVLCVLPLFHIYGMQAIMNSTLAAGNTLVLDASFKLDTFLDAIARYQVTRTFVVPPMLLAMAKSELTKTSDLTSLRTIVSGAAPLSPELVSELRGVVSAQIVQGFGMTETSPATHISFDVDDPAAVGTLLPLVEMRIVDPATREDVPAGDPGELWLRGPNVMAGYLNRPDETRRVLSEDGWLRTGDIGVVDEHGVLTITDRLKELIKYKGFQVAPAEIEGLLVGHPDILDAAVVGIPDETAGEVPKAFIVATPGSDLSEGDVIAYTRDRLAHYKTVRAVEFIDSVPRSASGKILRRRLAAS